MPTYHYKACNAEGLQKEGLIESESPRQARDQLRLQTLIPLEINETQKLNKQYKLSAIELALLTRNLAALLRGATPIEEALSIIAELQTKQKIKHIVFAIRDQLREGHALYVCLKQFPQVFSSLYCTLVNVGEQTGKLESVLLSLADYIENQNKIKQKVLQVLLYPCFLVFISILIIFFLLVYVMPKIISAFTERNQSLPMLTRVLIDISYFCSHYGIYCVFFIVGCVFCYQRVKLHPVIEQRRHAWLLKIPLLNTIIQLFNTTRFFYTASILTHAGIDLLHTLEMAKMAILNVMIRQGVTCSVDKIKNGTSLYFALKETGFFDPLALQLIANGEKSGRLAEMFSYSASQQEQKLTRYTNVFLTLFEPIIILMMGGIILLIVLAILLPIFSMDQLVQLQ